MQPGYKEPRWFLVLIFTTAAAVTFMLLLLSGCRERGPERPPIPAPVPQPAYQPPANGRYDYTPGPNNPYAEYLPGGPLNSQTHPRPPIVVYPPYYQQPDVQINYPQPSYWPQIQGR
jgi:hypothetical protein